MNTKTIAVACLMVVSLFYGFSAMIVLCVMPSVTNETMYAGFLAWGLMLLAGAIITIGEMFAKRRET